MLFATRHRKVILILFTAITLFFGYQTTKLQFGYELDDFFDKDEKDNQFYNEFFDQFDRAMPNAAMLGIECDKQIDYKTLLQIDSFSEQLEEVDKLEEVASITNLQSVYLDGEEPVNTNLLDLENEQSYLRSKRSLDSIPGQKASVFEPKRKFYGYLCDS